MSESDELDKLKEKYKYEIASLKRTIERFEVLRSWLVTTSLASLAFVLTFLLQIRIQSELPDLVLAQVSVVSLAAAVACALYTKFCYEATGMVADVKDFATLFPVFIELINKDEKTSAEEKTEISNLLKSQIDSINNLGKTDKNFDPHAEIRRFLVTGIALGVGLVCSVLYFWRYLF